MADETQPVKTTEPTVEETTQTAPEVESSPEPVEETTTETQPEPVEEKPVPEPVTAPEPSPAPVPVPAPKQAPVEAPTPKPAEQQPVVVVTNTQQNSESIKLVMANIDEQMKKYMDVMQPGKPVNAKLGAAQQYTLFKLMQTISNMPTDFSSAWEKVLSYFKTNENGCFSERYVFRFAEELHGSSDEHQAFFAMLNLAILTADPATRKEKVKEVSIEKTTKIGMTELARANFFKFYS